MGPLDPVVSNLQDSEKSLASVGPRVNGHQVRPERGLVGVGQGCRSPPALSLNRQQSVELRC